ncbi:transmembrane protein, putative [Medicago truncatula]|uniref:Transmembrane protein, putative n=1 Tax=Medicago truncatula TaxID=3880 RepID=Q2HSZ1_MEDTR|nr:hypothetical protein MtrDRAFT_AC150889g11v2 [Medicago truncatula]AES81191.1 transmembrane protein, putative [Medicago truncatula]
MIFSSRDKAYIGAGRWTRDANDRRRRTIFCGVGGCRWFGENVIHEMLKDETLKATPGSKLMLDKIVSVIVFLAMEEVVLVISSPYMLQFSYSIMFPVKASINGNSR